MYKVRKSNFDPMSVKSGDEENKNEKPEDKPLEPEQSDSQVKFIPGTNKVLNQASLKNAALPNPVTGFAFKSAGGSRFGNLGGGGALNN